MLKRLSKKSKNPVIKTGFFDFVNCYFEYNKQTWLFKILLF
jgi:hypothetical protein